MGRGRMRAGGSDRDGLYWKYGGGGNKGGWAMAPAKVAVAPAVQADFPVSLSGIGSLEATRQCRCRPKWTAGWRRSCSIRANPRVPASCWCS